MHQSKVQHLGWVLSLETLPEKGFHAKDAIVYVMYKMQCICTAEELFEKIAEVNGQIKLEGVISAVAKLLEEEMISPNHYDSIQKYQLRDDVRKELDDELEMKATEIMSVKIMIYGRYVKLEEARSIGKMVFNYLTLVDSGLVVDDNPGLNIQGRFFNKQRLEALVNHLHGHGILGK